MSREASRSPRVAIVTLGCAKNLVDSEHIASLLEAAGVEVCADPEGAPVAVVNTCGFIQEAKEESIDVILDVARLKEADLEALVVSGCLSERYGRELEELLPEVDTMVGVEPAAAARAALWSLGRRGPLPERCSLRSFRFTPPGWTYLRIAEGCDNRCAYCAIPSIRGPLVSRPRDEILAEAEQLLEDGVRELNLIAQDTTAYGRDRTGPRLHALLRELAGLAGGRWIRLLYTHPAHYYPELIEVLAGKEALCPYLDIPLQHISDPILERMGRGVSRAQIEELLGTLRSRIPDLTLRTTFMVGFPGETDEQFEELLEFVRRVRFDRLGAFRYSPEEDTRAERMKPRVPDEVTEERYHELMNAQQEIAFELAAERVGERAEVLVEESTGGGPGPVARSVREAPEVDPVILLRGAEEARPGRMMEVEIVGSRHYDCIAEPVGSEISR